MSYELLTESFLIQNVKNPARIIDRINNPELVIYSTSPNDLIDQCTDIVESDIPKLEKESKLTECITNYHTTLYTKHENI